MQPFEKVDRFFDSLLTDPVLPVLGYSVYITKEDACLYKRQGGLQRLTAAGHPENVPVHEDTRFRIASVSKLFTATAVMQQVEQGRLELDADISEYLGYSVRNPHFPEEPLTIRRLLSHISSLRDGRGYSISPHESLKEMLTPGGKYWNDGEHFAAPSEAYYAGPGGYYTYCNLNYGVLGTLVEASSGERFDRYTKKHVLEPLGIRASFNPGLLDDAAFAELSPLYKTIRDGRWRPDGVWTPQIDDYRGEKPPADRPVVTHPYEKSRQYPEDISSYVPGTNATFFSPQGGLRISPKELSLFASMMLRGGVTADGVRILSENSVKLMHTPVWLADPVKNNCPLPGAAYAHCHGPRLIDPKRGGDRIRENRDDIWLIGHTGSASGLNSGCFWNPEKKLAFCYAYNGLGQDPANLPKGFTGRKILQERTLDTLAEAFFDL